MFTREEDWTNHSVCRKTEHPEYNREAEYDKDIAILHLCKPLMFGIGFHDLDLILIITIDILLAVGPICLPDPAQDYDDVKALAILQSAEQYPDIPRVNVTTLTNQQCREEHGLNNITENMICAGEGGGREGEGGGPLAVLGQDGRYSQIGLQSWNENCAKPGYPGVYTRLTSLLDWVRSTTWPLPRGKQS